MSRPPSRASCLPSPSRRYTCNGPRIFEDFNPMKTILVVVNDFADYKRGNEIEDSKVVAEVLASSNAVNVVARQLSVASPLNSTDDLAAN